MKRSALISAAVLFLLLATAGAMMQAPNRAFTPTTYGTADFGYKAVFDLLQESDVSVSRNLGSFADLTERSTVWWVGASSLCDKAACAEGDEACRAERAAGWSGSGWLERGGTAVVFLPPAGGCDSIAGTPLPARSENASASEDRPTALVTLEGAGVPRARTLPDVTAFAAAGEWNVAVTADGQPFVLEKSFGGGRVVVVGDAAFLSNRDLARADAAPLVMDLVRDYGPPIFDERDKGFGTNEGAFEYLIRSPAVLVLAGLLLLGLAVTWWGAALPPRIADVAPTAAPTLESYVTSLAHLYARVQDHAVAAAQYRDFTLSQLRRRLGLAPDVPANALVERLDRQRRLTADETRLLRETPVVASASELSQLAEALDEIQRKAIR